VLFFGRTWEATIDAYGDAVALQQPARRDVLDRAGLAGRRAAYEYLHNKRQAADQQSIFKRRRRQLLLGMFMPLTVALVAVAISTSHTGAATVGGLIAAVTAGAASAAGVAVGTMWFRTRDEAMVKAYYHAVVTERQRLSEISPLFRPEAVDPLDEDVIDLRRPPVA
jgi:NADH:ubiquinone oxidoreductase subunit K